MSAAVLNRFQQDLHDELARGLITLPLE